MSYGTPAIGNATFGSYDEPLYAYQKTRPSLIDATAVIFEPYTYNAYLLIHPIEIAEVATIYEPHIFNALSTMAPAAIAASTYISKPRVSGFLAPNDTAPSYDFYRRTFLPVRDITGGVLISFIKGYDADADFFTVGSSAFNSTDVFQGDGSTAQEWDKFEYTDYSDLLRSFTYSYEQDILGSVILGYADISFDNVANTFSPYGDGPIADLILPYRPLKLYTGYKQLPYQVFVGQTTRLPASDSNSAQFHAMDFIASFIDLEISAGRVYLDVTTDEVIDDILQTEAGLSPTQYTLDTGLNTISFLSVPSGTKIGELFRDLIEAEQGRLYQTYDGEIRFDNRTNKLRPTALTLDDEYVYQEKEPEEGNVINRITITSKVREVQASQLVYPTLKEGSLTEHEDFVSFKVAAGASVEKFFDFSDPVTSFTHPTIGGGVTANSAQDGTGTNQNAALTFSVTAAFNDTVKYTFGNTSGADIYVTQVNINGTPATVVREINIDQSDATSIGKYGEQLLELKNNYFTDATYALTLANEIIDNNKDAPSTREILVKGIPYAAVGDVITYHDGLTYVIDAIGGTVSPQDGHVQSMRLRRVDLP